MKKKILLSVAFIEGATLMAFELLGAKILAPFLGTSLYVWTSVLVCTMCALALGYFFGGRISKKKNITKLLLFIIILNCVYLLMYSWVSKVILPQIVELELLSASLISSLILIFPPIFLFGTISPIIIKLLSNNMEEIGKISSEVYTTSTIGGIIATFIFGLILIPYYGIKVSVLISTFIFFLAGIIYLIYFFKYNEIKKRD